jgi:hypothetical protein
MRSRSGCCFYETGRFFVLSVKPRILELSIPALRLAIDVHVRAIFCRGIAVGWPLVVGRGMVVAPATATKLGLQFQFLFSGSSRHSLCGPWVVRGARFVGGVVRSL